MRVLGGMDPAPATQGLRTAMRWRGSDMRHCLPHMTPALSQADIADRRLCDTEVGGNKCKSLTGRPAAPDLHHISLGQASRGLALAPRSRAISGLIQHVLSVRSPRQVSSIPAC